MTVSMCSRISPRSFLILSLLVALTPAADGAAAGPDGLSARGLVPPEQVAGWESPKVDVPGLLREDAANAGRFDIPYRIGYPMTTDLSPSSSGTWEKLQDGSQVWRLRVRSARAIWIALGFDVFRLQDGGRLWAYDAAGRTVLGPKTTQDVRDHGQLWFPPIEGDTVVVELDWPAKLAGQEPRMHLGTVSHGYKPFGTIGASLAGGDASAEGFGDSGPCNIDVMCPLGANWQDDKRGVVMLLSGGSGFCTASLINTTANDCRPYVLTANHCSAGASTVFGFNFERPACGGGTPPAPTTQTVSGATVLARFADSDFTLLEMSSAPPESFGAYFNGWNRGTAPATSTIVIHHPRGDAKKISRDADAARDGTDYGPNHWRIEQYEEGTTEPASSGSPLFDQNHRIVGQLHGGTASCTSITWDEYGKVDASWVGGGTSASRLSDWLDPAGTGALATNGIDHQSCLLQPAGAVALNRSLYMCPDSLGITLRDDDLRGNATQEVTVYSDTEPDPETVPLTATQAGAGTFAGTFPLSAASPAHGDGQLSVGTGDTITVSYVDLDDGTGQTVTRTATASADCSAPAISSVQISSVTGNGADIVFATDEPATTVVRYGDTLPPATTISNPALVTSHSVHLAGLLPCRTYYVSVQAEDAIGNVGSDDNAGEYYTFTTSAVGPFAYAYSGPPIAIPDNDPAGGIASVSVTDVRTVADVNVKVNIAHAYVGDINLWLTGPNGTTITLASRVGGAGDNFTSTVFDDQAVSPIASGAPPFTGAFSPEGSLAAFDGVLSAGTWTLKVADVSAAVSGTITGFELELIYAEPTCAAYLRHAAHSGTDSCSEGGGGGGNGAVDPGEDLVIRVQLINTGPQPATGVVGTLSTTTPGVRITQATSSYGALSAGASGFGDPAFAVGVGDAVACGATIDFTVTATSVEGTWTTDTFSFRVGSPVAGAVTHDSVDVPKPILDSRAVTSSIVVADTGAVSDVNVGVTIAHTYDSDLTLTLIAPDGTRVTLSNRNGTSGDDYSGTVFDDQAAIPIAGGTPPYAGSYRPDQPLSVLNGIPANGTWRLEVADGVPTETGTLIAWSLTLTTPGGYSCTACALAPPGEVPSSSVEFGADRETLMWASVPSASTYHVYLGADAELPLLLGDGADSCERAAVTGTSVSGLAEVPGAGRFLWFLVRASNAGGMGPAGEARVAHAPAPRMHDSSGACP